MGLPWNHHEVETRWQQRWDADRLYEVDFDAVEPDRVYYNLVEFPYPSGDGLHVGHVFKYSGADVVGRWQRMRGRAVFQPMGWDSFGINAENYALKLREHPATVLSRTTERFRHQLTITGCGWDWSRLLATSDPDYYRWTQWVFLRLFRAGLAYEAHAPVLWCPSCATVLAREQLEGDRCERCDTPVVQDVRRQWFLRITDYVDRLLAGLDGLDWPEWAKQQQRDWIGRSEGREIDFEIADGPTAGQLVTAFTTRPDTLPGVTFVALSPDHPSAVEAVRADHAAEVEAWVDETRRRAAVSIATRADAGVSGVHTGTSCIHPLTGERVPLVLADYVLGGYATGSVMGVPAHDDRDRALAQVMGLPISGAALDESCWRHGRPAVRYRLHDWSVGRQRYWGAPIPVISCAGCGVVPVPDEDLPVLLPEVSDPAAIRPTGTGVSPLAAIPEFVATTCPVCDGPAERETDVLDTFVDSSWYFLRYPSTDVADRAWDASRTAAVLPPEQYAGGKEHVRRHHLYARFVTMALYDLGEVPFEEPFPRVRYGGLLVHEGAKMSKSRGNVIVPEHYVERYGADVLRLALLFCSRWEEGGDFRDGGIVGLERFLTRVWRLVVDQRAAGGAAAGAGRGYDDRFVDRTIAKVAHDIEAMAFNTAIAALMEMAGEMWAAGAAMSREQWGRARRVLVLLLAPFAPYASEEMWQRIGGPYSVHVQPWPEHDPAALAEDEVDLIVQVDGKVRDRIRVAAGTSAGAARERALASERVMAAVGDREVTRVVHVPDRLVNVVTG